MNKRKEVVMTVSVFLGYYSHDSPFVSGLILTCFDGALACLTSIMTGLVCLFSIAAAVKLLLDMGSDINAQIETNRNTALTLACFQVKQNKIIFLQLKSNCV